MLRRSVPIRTFSDWGAAPGHMEADLVSHTGPVAEGSWAGTRTLTDIATGWTESAPLSGRSPADDPAWAQRSAHGTGPSARV